MGWDTNYMPSGFRSFVKALELAGVPTKLVKTTKLLYVEPTKAVFTAANGERMVVEEYVAEYDDSRRRPRCRAEIVVYKEGQRPLFKRREDDAYQESYCQYLDRENRTDYWDSSL